MAKTVQDLFMSLIPKLGGVADSRGNCYGITCALDHYILHNSLLRFIDALKLISDRLEPNPDNFSLEIKSALKKQEQMAALSEEERVLLDIADLCKRISFYQEKSDDDFAAGTRLQFLTDLPNAQAAIRGFSRVCEQDELTELFSSLENLIQGCAHPISINIGNNTHIMVIRYNPELREWSFFDSNSRIGEWIDRTKGFSSLELSETVKLALGSPQECPFVASVIRVVHLSKDRAEVERDVVRSFSMDKVGTASVAAMEKMVWCVKTKAPLFLTAITGEIGEFRAWLAYGIDPHKRQISDGWACLHLASCYNHFEIVKALLEARVDPNVTSRSGSTALHVAAAYDRSSIAKFLITSGADVDRQDTNGESALHIAAENGYLQIVLGLIDAKANLNLLNHERYTALQLAAQNNCVATTDALVSAGAGVNLKNLRGDSALHIAVQYDNPEIVRALVRSVVLDTNLLNLDGDAALHVAVRYADSTQLLEALTGSRTLDLNIEDRKGNTALHVAAQLINLQAVQVLLKDKRVNPNMKNRQNVTPLQIAIVQGDPKLVERFLNFPKVDVSVRTADGKNLYELAQTRGEADIIEVLLQDRRTRALASVSKLTPRAQR